MLFNYYHTKHMASDNLITIKYFLEKEHCCDIAEENILYFFYFQNLWTLHYNLKNDQI